MSFSVRARADSIATFRFTCVHLMETLGGWVPTTPELEVKVLFGKHLWELAQHADAFGRRTHELRLALQASREPTPDFLELLQRMRSMEATGDRVSALYDVALPEMRTRYHGYIEQTDELLDEPSVRVLESAIWDMDRLERDRQALVAARPDLAVEEEKALELLRAAMSTSEMIDYRPEPAAPVETT